MKKIHFYKLTFMLLLPFLIKAEETNTDITQQCQNAYQAVATVVCSQEDINTANAGIAAIAKITSKLNRETFNAIKQNKDFINYYRSDNGPRDYFIDDTKSEEFTNTFCGEIIEQQEQANQLPCSTEACPPGKVCQLPPVCTQDDKNQLADLQQKINSTNGYEAQIAELQKRPESCPAEKVCESCPAYPATPTAIETVKAVIKDYTNKCKSLKKLGDELIQEVAYKNKRSNDLSKSIDAALTAKSEGKNFDNQGLEKFAAVINTAHECKLLYGTIQSLGNKDTRIELHIRYNHERVIKYIQSEVSFSYTDVSIKWISSNTYAAWDWVNHRKAALGTAAIAVSSLALILTTRFPVMLGANLCAISGVASLMLFAMPHALD